MPELESITVHGFRSIASITDLALGQVNLLIGPNGSGKSNFVGVFSLLHAIRSGRLAEYVSQSGGADTILHFGSKATSELVIHISFNNKVNQYRIVLRPTAHDQLFVAEEAVYFWDRNLYDRPYVQYLSPQGLEAAISDAASKRIAAHVRHHLVSWRLYHFHDTSDTSPIKKTADVNDNRYLRPDGSNLAAFLYLLRSQHPESYHLIRSATQRAAPFFDDFELEPQRLNKEKLRLEWRHKRSDSLFGATSLSDGTLRFIALSTLFLQPVELRPSVVLVDEPELGLHPHAVTLLASLIKQAAGQTQVILSTQSPLLLDHFSPEEVLVAGRVDGATQFKRLDPGQLGGWLEDYSLGQLWEKNELGGRPRGD